MSGPTLVSPDNSGIMPYGNQSPASGTHRIQTPLDFKTVKVATDSIPSALSAQPRQTRPRTTQVASGQFPIELLNKEGVKFIYIVGDKDINARIMKDVEDRIVKKVLKEMASPLRDEPTNSLRTQKDKQTEKAAKEKQIEKAARDYLKGLAMFDTFDIKVAGMIGAKDLKNVTYAEMSQELKAKIEGEINQSGTNWGNYKSYEIAGAIKEVCQNKPITTQCERDVKATMYRLIHEKAA